MKTLRNQSNLAFVNGTFVPAAKASISIFDRGFLYGDGIFETLRVYNGKVFRLAQHLWRLRSGVDALQIRGLQDADFIANAVRELIRRNRIREGFVRILVTRGNGDIGLNIAHAGAPLLVIYAQNKPPRPETEYRRGWCVVTSKILVSADSWLEVTKTISRVHHVAAKAEAEAAGVEDALLLNTRGQLTEGTTSNLFIIKKGCLLTPPIADGLLGGITRAAILELAQHQRIPTSEEHLTPRDLYRADEAFLSSTLIELMPIVEADGKKIGAGFFGNRRGKSHPITTVLRYQFRELVRRELGKDVAGITYSAKRA